MSEIDQLLKQAINIQGLQKSKFTITIGTVIEINGDTCKVDSFEEVRLNAIIDDLQSQFTIYPKLGSKVIIARLENESDMFVIRVSEVEKVTIKINDQLFELKDGKFKIQVGNVSLKSILNNAFQRLQSSIITTPSGPGNFSPADVAAFAQYNNEVNQLLS